MDLIYVLGPVLGGIFGGIYGSLINGRVIVGSANWVPTYVVLGALSGLARAAKVGGVKKEDREKGELLTETKAYKKKSRKKKEKTTTKD